jgi:hypothetical protein
MEGISLTGRSSSKIESIDPTDPVAVADAIREQGFHEQRMIDLKNRAIRLGHEELSEAEGARQAQSIHARIAAREAIETQADVVTANGYRKDD